MMKKMITMMIVMIMIMMIITTIVVVVMMMLIIVPHVTVVGRAPVPMVLLVVGFQLLIHVNGQPLKAFVTFSN